MRLVFLVFSVLASAVFYQNCGSHSANLIPQNEANDPNSQNPDPLPKLETIAPYGQVYYSLSGTKGVVVCFHGAGGSATGWTREEKFDFLEDLRKQNYSFVCPTSLDRQNGQWSNTNDATNLDVINVDALLSHLQISNLQPLFITGHSNGGGFTSRFAIYSARKPQIKAVSLSNASGLNPVIASTQYNFPTIFNFSTVMLLLMRPTSSPTLVFLTASHLRCQQFSMTSPQNMWVETPTVMSL